MLVLDASVAVKWFVPEERRPEARAILAGGEELVAPEIIVAEVGTGLSRKARLGDISAAAARGAISDWLAVLGSGAVVLTPVAELLESAYEISIALDHQLPDCLYLALARHSQCPLVTADGQLAREAKALKGMTVQLLGA